MTLCLSLMLASGWTISTAANVLEPLERLVIQAQHWLHPTPGFKAPITVIAIDEAALTRHGQMPWNRQLFARLLDRLRLAGATVVGIDVAFTEPSVPAADAALAAALRGMPTVLPAFVAYAGAGGEALQVVEPLPALARASAGLGSVQITRHQQTQIWEIEPYQDVLGDRLPSFPVALAAAYRGAAWSTPRPGPLWRQDPWLIRFRGPANTVPRLSVVDVLGTPPQSLGLRGRAVLVGAMAAGLPDTNFAVPDMRGGPMSGVEVFANALDNLLQDGFWRRLGMPPFVTLMGLLAIGPGWWLFDAGAWSRHRHLVWVGASSLWIALAIAAFGLGIWLEVVPVLGFLFSCYFGGTVIERAYLVRSRHQLLERYASDLAVESQRQRARLEGELHDGLQQLMLAMDRELRQIRRALQTPERAEERVERARDIANQAIDEIKRIRQDLLPPVLRREGLEGALQSLGRDVAARSGMLVSVEQVDWVRLPMELEVELYWLIKEALNNAEKHAQASAIRIRLARTGQSAFIEVFDDGRGFAPPDLSIPPAGGEHSGLHRMWLKMRGRGGDMRIASGPGGGSRVCFILPCAALAKRT